MFINTDYSKRPREAHYYLAKPNMEVISSIIVPMSNTVNIKLGAISELTLSTPYYIEDGHENMIENPNIEMIQAKMLVKVIINKAVEWFIIDSIDETGSDDEVLSFTAFSLGYELSNKVITRYEEDSVNAQDVLNASLEKTGWSLKYIAPRFLSSYRSMSVSSTNGLELSLEAADTFNGILFFHTDERRVSLLDGEDFGSYRGMAVDYGRLLENVSSKRESKDLVTRMYVEGSEGIGIQSVNPTGQNFIEDYSYYLYPFERDSNRNVIKKSNFMSDALCHALLDQKELILSKATEIRDLVTQSVSKRLEIANKELQLAELDMELDTILNLLDVAKSTGDTTLINTRRTEETAKRAEITTAENQLATLQVSYAQIEIDLVNLYNSINHESNFTESLITELQHFTIEKEWSDDRYTDPQELFDAAQEQFEEYRVPSIEMSIGLVNFFAIVEEEYYWDKLNLGDFIRVRHPRMNLDYYARITEIQYNFSDDSISITISSTSKVLDDETRLAEIIKGSETASSILANSKYKWDSNNEKMSMVEEMLQAEHDANKRKITAGVNNQIEIGKRGMIVRSIQYPDEVIVVQAGIIALSRNNGQDWQTAITPYGIIADRLMGNIIAGQNLIITNSAGSFVIDDTGLEVNMDSIVIKSTTSPNVVNDWNKNIDDLVVLDASFTIAKGRISLVVSETNEIKGESIASSIVATPTAIALISQNVDITGKVTFNTFDANLKADINVFNGWRSTGTTLIDGANISTGSISAQQIKADSITADKIKTEQLIVGENIQMGANASISWSSVTSAPTIPTTAAEIGAHPNTWVPTASQIGAHPNTWVPTASQVGARPVSWVPTAAEVGARPVSWTPTAAEVGAIVNHQSAVFDVLTNYGNNPGLYMSFGDLYINASYISAGTLSGRTVTVSNAGINSAGSLSSSIRFWAGSSLASASSAPFRVTHGGAVYASNINITGGTITGGSISVTSDVSVGANLLIGLGNSEKRISFGGHDAWIYSYSNNLYLDTSYVHVLGTLKASNFEGSTLWNSAALNLEGGQGHIRVKSSSGGEAILQGMSGSQSGFKWTATGLQVINSSNTGLASLVASNISASSERKIKKDIKNLDTSLQKVKKTNTYSYLFKNPAQGLEDKRHLGLIHDEAPEEIITDIGVDLYSMNTMLWRAVQELSAQVDYLYEKSKKK